MKHDRSVVAVVLANLLTIGIALWQDWPLVMMLWPYWCQSVAIGWHARQRILALPEADDAVHGPLPGKLRDARWMAKFFALHYGGFHLLYGLFLLVFTGFAVVGQVAPELLVDTGTPSAAGTLHWYDPLLVLALAYGFWSGQRAAFPARLAADRTRRPGVLELMSRPYLRVLPMHLTLLFALPLSGAWPIVLFGAFKTLADVGTQVLEQRDLGAGAAPTTQATAGS